MDGITFYFEWEVELMEWLQSSIGGIGEKISAFLSYFGEEIALVAIIGFVYWCLNKEFGRYLGVSICLGITANALVKNIFLRRRPYFDNPNVKCLKAVNSKADIMDIAAQGYSFPSGHSTNAVIAYVGIGYYKKHKGIITFGAIFSILIALARVIVGVHYPTDVIVGLLMGVVIMFASGFLIKKVKKLWLLYLIVFIISCVGLFYCKTDDYYTSLGIMGGFFLGDLFNVKFVNHEKAEKWYKNIFRLIGGFALFFGLSTLLKLPFSKEFLEGSSMGAFMIRFVRYLICTFAIIGLYPMLFNKLKKVF